MTYAFSAKVNGPAPDPDPIPPNPPGPGGGEGGEDEELVTFQLSGGSAMPYVPFNFSIVASKPGTYPGILSARFADGSSCGWSYRKRGVWANARLEHTIGVETVRREASSVVFRWKIDEKEYSYSVAYGTGKMTPVIHADKLYPEQSAEWTVSYSGGDKCYATSLSQLSASVWLEMKVEGEWGTATHCTMSKTKFDKGVQKGSLRISRGFPGSHIRLCVRYAGVTSYHEVRVYGIAEIDAPAVLHIYGKAKSLMIKGI